MKLQGNRISLDVEEHVPHDVLSIGHILGFEEEAKNCAKRAGDWISSTRQ